MSYTKDQLETIENIHADFDGFISQSKWEDAFACIENMGDLGYETEATFMLQTYNRKRDEAGLPYGFNGLTYEPVEDTDHPIITPEEDDAPALSPKESEFISEIGDDGRLHFFKK